MGARKQGVRFPNRGSGSFWFVEEMLLSAVLGYWPLESDGPRGRFPGSSGPG